VFADLTTNDPHYALIQTMEAGDLAESSSFLKSVQANRIKLGEIGKNLPFNILKENE